MPDFRVPSIMPVKDERGEQIGWTVRWPETGGLKVGEIGTPIRFGSFKSAQVMGDFGSGGRVAIEGTNDNVNYFTLTDKHGAPLEVTTSSIVEASEISQRVRPHVIAGDSSTSLVVIMFFRRP